MFYRDRISRQQSYLRALCGRSDFCSLLRRRRLSTNCFAITVGSILSGTPAPVEPFFKTAGEVATLCNILVDPATCQITGIVDWECVGTRPHWEDTYPQFLLCPEITEEESFAPGDTDLVRVECWENWENRREFRKTLDIVGISPKMAQDRIKEYGECCTNVLSEISSHYAPTGDTCVAVQALSLRPGVQYPSLMRESYPSCNNHWTV